MNTPLPNKSSLPQANEPTGMLTAVSNPTNTGRPRKLSIADSAGAQQLANPLIVTTERVLLAEYTAGMLSDEGSSNSLAIREGTDRHSFDDGYYLFEFQYHLDGEEFQFLVSLETWNDSDTNSRIQLIYVVIASGAYVFSIWRDTATAFRIYGYGVLSGTPSEIDQNGTRFLKAIYGHKLIAKRTTED